MRLKQVERKRSTRKVMEFNGSRDSEEGESYNCSGIKAGINCREQKICTSNVADEAETVE